jgi:hypothetical protein
MQLRSIEELVQLLKSSGESLQPITNDELSRIERFNEKSLPEVYKEFLLQMGKGAGRFMQGSSVFYDELSDLQEGAEELINENGLEALPTNSFVFWMHQGYQMAYFILGESDNPKVYYYSEGKELKSSIEKGSLLEFFKDQLELSGIAT